MTSDIEKQIERLVDLHTDIKHDGSKWGLISDLEKLITKEIKQARQNVDQAVYLAEKKGYERGLKDGENKGRRNMRWHINNQTGNY